MSKRAYISRYFLIIKQLRKKSYTTFQELERYMGKQFEYLQSKDDDLEFAFSKRTFQRDIKEINTLFGLDIEFSKKEKGYYIEHGEAEDLSFQRMLEAFDLFNSLNIASDLTPFVHVEKRKPAGTENLYGLLHAIKNKLQISYLYEKYWDNIILHKTLHPYALKEFKNRWYVLGKDVNDKYIKTFGLDRISNLEISTIRFKTDPVFNMEDIFCNCYGIITPDDQEVEVIILSFTPEQGKYAKSLPLHESQQVLIDNDKEIRIQLKLYVTFDFMMELLSYGDAVKVIAPLSLAKEIKEKHRRACK